MKGIIYGRNGKDFIIGQSVNIMNNVIIYTGQEVSTNNWVWYIDPTDDRFYNIKTIEWQPKNLEDIGKEYNMKVVVE